MLSWLSGKKRHDPAEEAHQVRCRMGVHERSAIIAEGRDLYSTCIHCDRRLVRVGGDWRVALGASGAGSTGESRQAAPLRRGAAH